LTRREKKFSSERRRSRPNALDENACGRQFANAVVFDVKNYKKFMRRVIASLACPSSRAVGCGFLAIRANPTLRVVVEAKTARVSDTYIVTIHSPISLRLTIIAKTRLTARFFG